MASADHETLLQAYRQRVLKETANVDLRGLLDPEDCEEQYISLPLERVYIRLQAIQEAQALRAEKEEERRLAAEARERESRLAALDPRRLFGRLSARRAVPEGRRPPARPSLLSMLRTLGEYPYLRGETYAASERPKPVDPEKALQEHERLVILGAPGAGKSTLLRYLARRAAQEANGPIPILVLLGKYAANLSKDPNLLLRDFALNEASLREPALHAALAEAVEQERVLWLVDTLDEAHQFRGDAARQVAYLPGQLVLTSRPVGYGSPPELADLPHYKILPLEVQAVQDFLHRWFTVLAERRGEEEEWVEQQVALLEKQLQQPCLQALARNHLMLTFLVLLAGEEPIRELPATRAGLYAAYLRKLLTWETCRRKRSGQNELALGLLQGEAARRAALDGAHLLGWRLHYGGQGAALPTREDLVDFLAEALPQAHDLLAAERLNLAAEVVTFWKKAGLFTYRRFKDHTFLVFRHLTFQEYGAAKVLADLWEGGKEARKRAWAFLKPRLHHPAWREVLLLLGTVLEDATDLVRRVRTARSPYEWELLRDHALAAAIVGEGARVAEKEIRRLVRVLSRPLARWRQVAFWVGYTSPLIALFLVFLGGGIRGLIWLWRHWPWWGAIGGNLLWLLGWGLGIKYLPSEPVLDALERLTETPRFQSWYGFLWRRLTLPCSAWRMQAVKALTPLHDVDIPVLIHALGDADKYVRAAAAEALGRIGDAQAIPALTQALRDETWWVRRAAAKALGRIGDAQTIPALTQALGAGERWMRKAAAEALGRIGDAQAIPALTQALGDGERWVRKAAAEALGRIGDAQAIPALTQALGDEAWWVRRAAAEALGRIGDTRAVPGLLRALEDEDENEWVRRAAAEALGRIGDSQAIPSLRRALWDKSRLVSEAAAKALGTMGDSKALPFLIRALERESLWESNATTIKALVKIGSPAVVPLIQILNREENGEWLVGEAAAKAAEVLGRIGDSQAVPALIKALENKNKEWWVREAAAKALGKIGDTRAVPGLLRTLEEEEERVCQAAAEALGRIRDPRAVPALIRRLREAERNVYRSVIDALYQIGNSRQPLSYLIQAIKSEDANIRWKAAWALGRVNDSQATLYLIQALKDEKWWVRWAAAIALSKTNDALAISHLAQASTDENAEVRWAAVRVLGHIGNHRVFPYLAQRVSDEDERVRVAAIEGLGYIHDRRAISLLVQALQDPVENVRLNALWALKHTGFVKNPQIFLGLLHDSNPDIRESSIWILRSMDTHYRVPYSKEIIEHMLYLISEDNNDNVRFAATGLLGSLGSTDAFSEKVVRSLVQTLRTETNRKICQGIAWALSQSNLLSVVLKQLLQLMKSKEPQSRLNAILALRFLSKKMTTLLQTKQIARALWWRLTDLEEWVCNAAYDALQAVAARWAELAVNDLPRHDPLQPQAMTRRQRAFWALLAAGAFLLSFTLTALMELLASGAPDSPQAWRAMLFKALLFGVLAGLTTSLGAVGKWLWGRVQAKTS